MPDDSVCPSCGHDKKPKQGLCFYCYHRGNHNTLKMITLGILLGYDMNNLTTIDTRKLATRDLKKFSPYEIVDKFNQLSYIRYPGNIKSFKKYLHKFTRFKIISASKVRSSKPGRPKLVYRCRISGMKLFQAYIKRWRNGGILLLHKKHQRLQKISTFDRERASSIRGRMINDMNYNSLDYIFNQRNQKV